MSDHLYCGVGNWIVGLADYTLTACKPDPKEIASKQTAVTLTQQAVTALASAPKNACRDGYVYIPAGSFMMGSEDGYSDERPVRAIHTDAFCMSKSETTNVQYQSVVTIQRATPQFELVAKTCKDGATSIISRGSDAKLLPNRVRAAWMVRTSAASRFKM